jgi:hypothetical protein
MNAIEFGANRSSNVAAAGTQTVWNCRHPGDHGWDDCEADVENNVEGYGQLDELMKHFIVVKC